MKLYEVDVDYYKSDSLIDFVVLIERTIRDCYEAQKWAPGWHLKIGGTINKQNYIHMTLEVHGETVKKTYYSALIPVSNSPCSAPYSCGFLFKTEAECRAWNHDWTGEVIKVEV